MKSLLAFASASAVLAGVFLCYYDKPGWGWFVFAAIVIAGGVS